MKYKVEKGTELYSEVKRVFAELLRVRKEAFKLAKKYGSTRFIENDNFIAGGIRAIELDEKPEGFKYYSKERSLFFPKVGNKKVYEEFNALPTLTHDEFNSVIGFKEQWSDMSFHRSFGCAKSKDCYIIDISNECEFTPPKDCIEILESEYIKLKSYKAD